jgi:GNAT superfamily N-acetyltransferase
MSRSGRYVSLPVRHATMREIPEIESLTVAAYTEFKDQIPPAIFDAYLADTRHLADRWDEAEVLVAELEGRIAGTVSFYSDASREGLGLPNHWAGFRRLAVAPEMRGHGVGWMLVGACVDRARAIEALTVGIHTASFMKAALRIYDRMGFKRSPEYDLDASEILRLQSDVGAVIAIAYQLELTPSSERASLS